MKEVTSDEARSNFRDLLDEVILGEHATITRYGKPIAALVPLEWYEKARMALGEGQGQ